MSHRFTISSNAPLRCIVMAETLTQSCEISLGDSTSMIDMTGKLSEVTYTTCAPRPEPEIWKKLSHKNVEVRQIERLCIPGPILRMLLKPFPADVSPQFYKLTARDSTCTGGIRYEQYMALPEDTMQHPSVFSNPSWESRRREKWFEVGGMTPEQLEVTVETLLEQTLQHRRVDGLPGLDLALEVFNWTALEYEEALRIAAKVLYRMFTQGKVRSCGRDHWKIESPENEDTDGV